MYIASTFTIFFVCKTCSRYIWVIQPCQLTKVNDYTLVRLYLNVHEMSDNFSNQQQILIRLRPFNAAVITYLNMKRVSLFLFLCFKCFIVCLALLLFPDRNKLLEGFWHVLIMHLKIILLSRGFFYFKFVLKVNKNDTNQIM
jgi:hypothetical protein